MMPDWINRRDLLTITATAFAIGGLTPLLSQGQVGLSGLSPPSPGSGLRAHADAKGLLSGTAVTAEALASDERLVAVLRQDCNILVPENELKWGVIQDRPGGPLNFDKAEEIYAFAVANNMSMRGHALSWWNSQPAWAADYIGAMTPAKAGDYLQNYIHAVASHWRGRLVQWDVVNEPIGAKDVILDRLYGPKLGDRFMDLAFEAAADADPGALRVLNHDLIAQDDWYQQAQFDSTLRLIDRLMNRGAKIQAFAFEAHLTTAHGFMEAKWRRFCDHLTGMGLKLMITELDVDDGGTIGDVARRDAESAALAGAVLDVMLSYPACLGVLTWGAVDSYSWLRKSPDRQRKDRQPLRPTPRDDNYQPKPLWNRMAQAFDSATRAG